MSNYYAAAAAGGGSITFEANRTAVSTTTNNTDTATTGSFTVSAGSLVVVLMSCQSTAVTVTSVADNSARAFTKAAGPQTSVSGTSAEIWYYENHPGGSITVTGVWNTVSTSTKVMQAFSFTGVATSGGPVATTNSSISAATTHTGAALATTGVNVIVSLQQGGSSPSSPAGSNSFTLLSGSSGRQIGLYRIVTSNGSYSPESTTSNSFAVTDVAVAFLAQ